MMKSLDMLAPNSKVTPRCNINDMAIAYSSPNDDDNYSLWRRRDACYRNYIESILVAYGTEGPHPASETYEC